MAFRARVWGLLLLNLSPLLLLLLLLRWSGSRKATKQPPLSERRGSTALRQNPPRSVARPKPEQDFCKIHCAPSKPQRRLSLLSLSARASAQGRESAAGLQVSSKCPPRAASCCLFCF
ncbi:uncharacterized protein ASCRUDRAFT_69263 [Ascoidea rubescens DSM 1968]|uniref:Uncharacterized protein n=1 Tax=Ascoidea rubescens DSM 1968 TaxID=1344418 RepID=A0A1D2VLJ8_9ASCO|nr:hypothetical protein ASCRUDRAFT_69263 [Ascoidea rubescens DSM 1968]ODV62465.1 hypothetical protein ASCRUDRAFT_69263 [Ascoidea rubescens DSM 1968]